MCQFILTIFWTSSAWQSISVCAKGLLNFSLVYLRARMLSCFSCVQLFVALWSVAHQAPLSTGFSRQECWSGLPFPPPGFPTQGSHTRLFTSSALAGRFFTTSATWEALSLSKTSLSLEAQHTDKRKQCLKGKVLVAQSCSTLWPHGL